MVSVDGVILNYLPPKNNTPVTYSLGLTVINLKTPDLSWDPIYIILGSTLGQSYMLVTEVIVTLQEISTVSYMAKCT